MALLSFPKTLLLSDIKVNLGQIDKTHRPVLITKKGIPMIISNINRLTLCISLLSMVALSGCATLPNVITEQVDNRRVEYLLVRHDTVPVVFENGIAGGIQGI